VCIQNWSTGALQDVTDEEYRKFFRAITKGYEEPLGWAHFKAEGDVEFR
jgi:heat shock protein 90kDa beta